MKIQKILILVDVIPDVKDGEPVYFDLQIESGVFMKHPMMEEFGIIDVKDLQNISVDVSMPPSPEEMENSSVIDVKELKPRQITFKEYEQLAEYSLKEDDVELEANLDSFIVFDVSDTHKRVIHHTMVIQETKGGKKYIENFTTYFSIKDDVVSIENDHLDSDNFDIDISQITDLL
jgi:hypothetical protein